jgi:periplasmic protein CpxP/Spy
MKKLIQTLVLSTALLGTATAYAGDRDGYHRGEGDHQGHGKGGKHHLHHLVKKLDLTEAQKSAIEEIHKAHRKGGAESHKRPFTRDVSQLDPTLPDYQEQVAAIAKEQAAKLEQAIIERAQVHAKIYEVLTPEQRVQLQEMKNKRREKFKKAE